VDKGTGLGLSTVYGIVKQNKGFINVYNEPGKGTTIKIYLPRNKGKAVEIQEESTEKIPQGHGETILLVEDDLHILKLAKKILNSLEYTVLAANTPKEAMRLTREHTGKIHLLVTDVIMPEMNGLELSKQLKSLSPDLKCIFMSGYTANSIAHHGVLDEGVHFIQKPFLRILLYESTNIKNLSKQFWISGRKAVDLVQQGR
jgi:CheY-like chemotaxis protein